MLAFAYSFFERAVQHRAPRSRTPVAGGYLIEVEPVFAHVAADALGMPQAAPYEAGGVVDVGFANGLSSGCYSQVVVPTSAPVYRFRLPMRGAFLWSELSEAATSFDSVAVAIVADSGSILPFERRAQITFSFFVFAPISMTQTSLEQSVRFAMLAGHVRECIRSASAEEVRMVEYPSFGRRLQIGSDQRLANELYALEFTVSVRETLNNTRKYGMQV